MQLIHFDCVNGFLNSIKEIIWQTEAIYRCPLTKFAGNWQKLVGKQQIFSITFPVSLSHHTNACVKGLFESMLLHSPVSPTTFASYQCLCEGVVWVNVIKLPCFPYHICVLPMLVWRGCLSRCYYAPLFPLPHLCITNACVKGLFESMLLSSPVSPTTFVSYQCLCEGVVWLNVIKLPCFPYHISVLPMLVWRGCLTQCY